MNSPAIVVVDPDPTARGTLELALGNRYASDYTIACALSPPRRHWRRSNC